MVAPAPLQFCVVCQHNISPAAATGTTLCGHVFHFECLARCMRESGQCPVCRENLVQQGGSSVESSSTDAEDGGVEVEFMHGEVPVAVLRQLIDRTGSDQDDHTSIFDIYFSPALQPPNAANIIHCIRDGNVTAVENMLSHDRTLARISDGDGDTLIHLAVMAQNEYLMRYLAQDGGVNINATNRAQMTPLHYAVFAQNTRLVALVLQLGGFVDAGDASGKTALMYAAINCQTEDLAQLIEKQANVNSADLVGDTALHHAVRSKSLPSVRVLSTFPYFDVNVSNYLGDTALHIAYSTGSNDCGAFLSVCGANPAQKNKAGRVPCQRSPALPTID